MLILASGSPRRRELLGEITPDFAVIVTDADEAIDTPMPPAQVVETLALRKARAVFCVHREDVVIGCDTVVALEGEILGKPRDEGDARRMLRRLSGTEHSVLTGVAVLWPGGEARFHDETRVRFRPLTDGEIDAYVASGEPMDKAGSYGIQGGAAAFVEAREGSLSNVIGLPVERLARFLSDKGLI